MGQPEQEQRTPPHQSEWKLGATNPVGGWEPQTRPIRGCGAESRVGGSGGHPILRTVNLGLEVQEHPSGKGSLPPSLASTLYMGKLRPTEGK